MSIVCNKKRVTQKYFYFARIDSGAAGFSQLPVCRQPDTDSMAHILRHRMTQKSFCKESNPSQSVFWLGLLVLKVGFWVTLFGIYGSLPGVYGLRCLYYQFGIDEITCNCNCNDNCMFYDCSYYLVHGLMLFAKKGATCECSPFSNACLWLFINPRG